MKGTQRKVCLGCGEKYTGRVDCWRDSWRSMLNSSLFSKTLNTIATKNGLQVTTWNRSREFFGWSWHDWVPNRKNWTITWRTDLRGGVTTSVSQIRGTGRPRHTGRRPCEDEVMCLQAKECQGFQNCPPWSESRRDLGTIFLSEASEGTIPADTVILDFYPSELWMSKFLLY